MICLIKCSNFKSKSLLSWFHHFKVQTKLWVTFKKRCFDPFSSGEKSMLNKKVKSPLHVLFARIVAITSDPLEVASIESLVSLTQSLSHSISLLIYHTVPVISVRAKQMTSIAQWIGKFVFHIFDMQTVFFCADKRLISTQHVPFSQTSYYSMLKLFCYTFVFWIFNTINMTSVLVVFILFVYR